MSDNNIDRRVKILRAAMRRQKIDALIVTNFSNVTYLTGFLGEDSWALATPKTIYLITDSRYSEQAKDQCAGCRIIERKDAMAKTIGQILKKQKAIKNVGVEDSTSVAVFSSLQKELKKNLKKANGLIEDLRQIKDRNEIALIRKAAEIAQNALAATMKHIKPGVSENEIAGFLNLNIRRMGGRESFEAIVAFGANASQPHHLCSDRKLKKNDMVLIDWGVKYKGYCCDLTRSFAISGGTALPVLGHGRGSSLFKKVHSAVLEAQNAAIAKIKDGVSIAEVDSAARNVLKKYKLPVYGHGTGHGLGIEVHEKPVVSAKTKGQLKAGQVITIEPGVYMPDVLGVRIEDDILVTKTGCKILSKQI
jgi:Xaa-Pro aminopeptidase